MRQAGQIATNAILSFVGNYVQITVGQVKVSPHTKYYPGFSRVRHVLKLCFIVYICGVVLCQAMCLFEGWISNRKICPDRVTLQYIYHPVNGWNAVNAKKVRIIVCESQLVFSQAKVSRFVSELSMSRLSCVYHAVHHNNCSGWKPNQSKTQCTVRVNIAAHRSPIND